MIGETMERIEELTEEMGQCLGLPVKVIIEDGGGYVTIMCGGETLIADCTEYVEGSLQDMLSGMEFYKRIKEGK